MAQRFFTGQRDHAPHFGFGDAGGPAPLVAGVGDAKNILCRLAHHAGRVTVLVEHDFAALWRQRAAVELDQCHRALVDEHGVAAGVNQHDRVIGRCGAERVMHRQSFDELVLARLPLVLVPAAPDDPLAGRGFGGRIRNHGNDLGETLRVTKIKDQQRTAEARVMTMAFDEARYHHLAVDVDDLGVVAAIPQHVRGRADSQNPVAVDGHCLCTGHIVVNGHDIAINEQQVGDRMSVVSRVAAARREENK